MARKSAKKIDLSGTVSGIDKRGHEVRKYQDEAGTWYVERNNNGAVHPEQCKDEAEALALFNTYCEMD